MNNFAFTAFFSASFLLTTAAHSTSLPPIKGVQDAVIQLRMKSDTTKLLALKNLQKACTGRYRRALKDSPMILKLLQTAAKAENTKIKKAVIESYRCFSPEKFQTLLMIQRADKDPSVSNFAAEISARVSDPAMVEPLLEAWTKLGNSCLQDGLSKSQIDTCVWLTYAPGASVARASEALKRQTVSLVISHFESPYPKVREVAVETLTAAGNAKHAKALSELIKKEKGGHFASANESALLTRFNKRLKTLKSRK